MHAGLLEERVDDLVAAGQRPGVRGRRACPGHRAPGLDRDDRLASAHAPGDFAELASIAEAFEITE